MTPFALDTVVLLGLAFALGIGVGLLLRGRRARREPEPVQVVSSLVVPPAALSPVQAPPPTPESPALAPEDEQAEASPPAAAAPAPAGGVEAHPGQRPPALAAPMGGAPDDLKLLKGIGPQNEQRLHQLGIYHLSQIAAWTPDEAQWVGSYLAFPGRIERENWIGQAVALLSGTPAEQLKLPIRPPARPQ